MDRLTALEVFRRVIELDGFSAAARDLGLSNAAVSKAVKDLETRLGAQLIVRTTRTLHLTDVGQAYYRQITGVLDTLSEADELVRSETASPRGRLRVTAPMSLGLVALSESLISFCQTYPDILVDLHMSDTVVDLVGEGFDVALRGGVLQDSTFKARKLMDLDRLVLASPDYLARKGAPERPEALTEHDCLVYSGTQHTPESWTLERGEESVLVHVRPRLRVNSSIALKNAAVAGLGICVLPSVYVREALEEGSLVHALPGWQASERALYAVYPEQREMSRKLRVFLDHLSETFRTQRS